MWEVRVELRIRKCAFKIGYSEGLSCCYKIRFSSFVVIPHSRARLVGIVFRLEGEEYGSITGEGKEILFLLQNCHRGSKALQPAI